MNKLSAVTVLHNTNNSYRSQCIGGCFMMYCIMELSSAADSSIYGEFQVS